MSIANYGDLKNAVGLWLDRADLASHIPDFIALASTRIYYGNKDAVLPSEPVRTWSMQTSETPTVTSASFPLPARYLATQALVGRSGANWSLDYATPAQFAQYIGNADGDAQYFTILGGSFQLSSSATTTLTHYYYQSFAAFSADADTNALLTAAPGLWLHGALLEAYNFLGPTGSEEAKKAHRFFTGIVGGLNRNAGEFPGGSLRMVAR